MNNPTVPLLLSRADRETLTKMGAQVACFRLHGKTPFGRIHPVVLRVIASKPVGGRRTWAVLLGAAPPRQSGAAHVEVEPSGALGSVDMDGVGDVDAGVFGRLLGVSAEAVRAAPPGCVVQG